MVGVTPLSRTRTVSDRSVWAPRLGVRISRRGETAAVLAGVRGVAAVVFDAVVLEEPPPQPARRSPRANAAHAPPGLPRVSDKAFIVGVLRGRVAGPRFSVRQQPETPVAANPSRADRRREGFTSPGVLAPESNSDEQTGVHRTIVRSAPRIARTVIRNAKEIRWRQQPDKHRSAGSRAWRW